MTIIRKDNGREVPRRESEVWIRVFTLGFTWIDLWSLEGKEGTYDGLCVIYCLYNRPKERQDF